MDEKKDEYIEFIKSANEKMIEQAKKFNDMLESLAAKSRAMRACVQYISEKGVKSGEN
jgi:prefoldin subunit 5